MALLSYEKEAFVHTAGKATDTLTEASPVTLTRVSPKFPHNSSHRFAVERGDSVPTATRGPKVGCFLARLNVLLSTPFPVSAQET